eukprot:6938700-Alexandrium_andersonii.AAC.1
MAAAALAVAAGEVSTAPVTAAAVGGGLRGLGRGSGQGHGQWQEQRSRAGAAAGHRCIERRARREPGRCLVPSASICPPFQRRGGRCCRACAGGP